MRCLYDRELGIISEEPQVQSWNDPQIPILTENYININTLLDLLDSEDVDLLCDILPGGNYGENEEYIRIVDILSYYFGFQGVENLIRTLSAEMEIIIDNNQLNLKKDLFFSLFSFGFVCPRRSLVDGVWDVAFVFQILYSHHAGGDSDSKFESSFQGYRCCQTFCV
jgi:hypothetical protein